MRSSTGSETTSVPTSPGADTSSRAFEAFLQSEHVRLYRALYVVTGNEQEAEDLMQEAFLNVWERWDRVSRLQDPVGYLYRTAMNAFRSRYRQAVRRARQLLNATAPRDDFAEADEKDRVARALGGLTARQRAALVLMEMLSLSSEEAGVILGIKAGTVRALAFQGRAALREALEDRDDG